MKKRSSHNQTEEINLMPVISVLAVCLSFLLLTAVWVQVGTFELNQALGTEAKSEDKKDSESLWVEFLKDETVEIQLKRGNEVLSRSRVSNVTDSIDQVAQAYKEQNPDLNIAVVLPAPGSSYQDLIRVMDGLRKNKIQDIGIAPL